MTDALTLRADRKRLRFTAVFAVLGLAGTLYLAAGHHAQMVMLVWALTLAFCILLLLCVTLRVELDAKGLRQRWALGQRAAEWSQVARVQRSKQGLFFIDPNNKDLLTLLPVLSQADRQALFDAAGKRLKLRPDPVKPKYPITESWVVKR